MDPSVIHWLPCADSLIAEKGCSYDQRAEKNLKGPLSKGMTAKPFPASQKFDQVALESLVRTAKEPLAIGFELIRSGVERLRLTLLELPTLRVENESSGFVS